MRPSDVDFETATFRLFRDLYESVLDGLIFHESFWFDPDELRFQWLNESAPITGERTAVLTYRNVIHLLMETQFLTRSVHYEWLKPGRTH